MLCNKTHIWHRHPVVARPMYVHSDIETHVRSLMVGPFSQFAAGHGSRHGRLVKVKQCVLLLFLKWIMRLGLWHRTHYITEFFFIWGKWSVFLMEGMSCCCLGSIKWAVKRPTWRRESWSCCYKEWGTRCRCWCWLCVCCCARCWAWGGLGGGRRKPPRCGSLEESSQSLCEDGDREPYKRHRDWRAMRCSLGEFVCQDEKWQ